MISYYRTRRLIYQYAEYGRMKLPPIIPITIHAIALSLSGVGPKIKYATNTATAPRMITQYAARIPSAAFWDLIFTSFMS